MKPIDFFTAERLDLIVKYLQAKNYLSPVYNKEIESLYIRHIIMRTGGVEPVDCLTKTTEKSSVSDYLASFKNLVHDMKKNGFNPEWPIPVNRDNKMVNGAHRIATALALDIDDIPTQKVDATFWPWDFNWFSENGFSTEDKQRILKGFVDLHPEECSIFIVWHPCFSYIKQIKTVLLKYFDIVGDVNLDFEDNCIAFTNALLEIYEYNIRNSDGDDTTIYEKAKLLFNDYLSFKVIVVSNQTKKTNTSIFEAAKMAKNDIRDLLNHTIPKKIFCTCHCSDCFTETKYLSNILLSPNNIKYLKMRHRVCRDDIFISKIRNLSIFLPTIGINSTDDICVVRSGVMSALGILEDTDVDFITLSKYRKKFGSDSISLPHKDYDIVALDQITISQKPIPDDVLISDSEFHWYFKGCKFLNIDIVKEQKQSLKKCNDAIHLRQIELWEKMTGHIEQQKILAERISQEIDRRKTLQMPSLDCNTNQSKSYKYRLHIGKFDLFSKRKKDNKRIYRILGIKITIKKPAKK